MKNVFIILGVVIIIITTLLWGCENEIITSSSDSLTVKEARDWFESYQPEIIELKSGRNSKNKKYIKPNWHKTIKSSNKYVEVVETRILSQKPFGFAYEDAFNEWIETGNYGYITSMSKIVVMRYKKTGEMVSFIMTFVGDKKYLKEKDFHLWANMYTKKDKDFNGLVLYHSLKGEFINGWRFTNGEVTHKVTLDFDIGTEVRLKDMILECTDVAVYAWSQDCVTNNWSVTVGDAIEYGSEEICGTPYLEYVGTSTQCVWVDTGSSTTDGTEGAYEPDTQDNDCFCINTCPVCGGCLDDNLKVAGITPACPPCSCPVVDASDLKQNPKADCIYQKLIKGNLMKRYVQKFDGEFPVAHLKYELDYSLDDNENGKTDRSPDDLGDYWIKILINGNTLNERPTLGVAKTFIHETIHAEMYRKIKSVNNEIKINDFPGLFDYYTRYRYGNNGTPQHNLMAQHYIEIMVEALKEFDPSYSEEKYNAIAWSGLMKTVVWNKKTQAEKNRIINIIKQLKQNGNKNCNN
ncbi:MAG: hypothetical protein GXO47_10935 [Chlorobi bacterium]|nr:hypothetical protein [Chlorobiota bacterium]